MQPLPMKSRQFELCIGFALLTDKEHIIKECSLFGAIFEWGCGNSTNCKAIVILLV